MFYPLLRGNLTLSDHKPVLFSFFHISLFIFEICSVGARSRKYTSVVVRGTSKLPCKYCLRLQGLCGSRSQRYLVQYSDKDNDVDIKLIDFQLTKDDDYLHLLLHLNEDFDDDLLQDSSLPSND